MSEEKELPLDHPQDEQQTSDLSSNEQAADELPKEVISDTTDEPATDEYKEKFVRLYAEFENYRRRTNQERLDLIASANASLLKDLLPVLDDFERAILNNETLDDSAALKEGFKLIQSKFM